MKTTRFIVEFEFGSDWQRETQLKAFDAMMQAMSMHMERCHKGNKLLVTPTPTTFFRATDEENAKPRCHCGRVLKPFDAKKMICPVAHFTPIT